MVRDFVLKLANRRINSCLNKICNISCEFISRSDDLNCERSSFACACFCCDDRGISDSTLKGNDLFDVIGLDIMLFGVIIKIITAEYGILISVDQCAVYTCNGIIIHRYNILNLRLINILRIDLHIYGISDITSLMVDLRIDTGNGICKVFCPAYLLNTELILDIRFIIILDTRIEHIIAVAYDAVCLSCDLICEKRSGQNYGNDKNDA